MGVSRHCDGVDKRGSKQAIGSGESVSIVDCAGFCSHSNDWIGI